MICSERLSRTVPMAMVEEKNTAKTASELSVLLCINLRSSKDAMIEKDIAVRKGKKLVNTPIATPAKAKCDNVSPIRDILLETTNIPKIGAVIERITAPISALTIKSCVRISIIN